MYNKEKLYSVRALVVVHILNFQQDLVVMWFIRIELIIRSTSKVDRDKVHIHVVHDVLSPLICIKHNGDGASKEPDLVSVTDK